MVLFLPGFAPLQALRGSVSARSPECQGASAQPASGAAKKKETQNESGARDRGDPGGETHIAESRHGVRLWLSIRKSANSHVSLAVAG